MYYQPKKIFTRGVWKNKTKGGSVLISPKAIYYQVRKTDIAQIKSLSLQSTFNEKTKQIAARL